MPQRNAPTPVLPRPPLTTPLVWAGGGVLLTLSLWLTGVFALVRAFANLVD